MMKGKTGNAGQEKQKTGVKASKANGWETETDASQDLLREEADVNVAIDSKGAADSLCSASCGNGQERSFVTVVGVRFKPAGKIYYFNPEGFSLEAGDKVIVETARGLEYGEVASPAEDVCIKKVIKPLKKVVRIADEQDTERYHENLKKKQSALDICQKKIEARKLEMKLIDVEYTFDNTKIIFYFTADDRVDFRELVKDLAGIFKMRIELRQIGVRDEAKMLGGIGTCGRSLCCHTWLPDFEPVSIKMAKTQGLSLNPAKISGICGRLMCCLKYENEAYGSLKEGLPEPGDRVKTPDGPAVVVDTNVLRQQVRVRLFLDYDKNKQDSEDKLSQEISVYKKSEIRRLGRRHGNKKQAEYDDELFELSDEVKDLLRD